MVNFYRNSLLTDLIPLLYSVFQAVGHRLEGVIPIMLRHNFLKSTWAQTNGLHVWTEWSAKHSIAQEATLWVDANVTKPDHLEYVLETLYRIFTDD
jgi:hypothetical protein